MPDPWSDYLKALNRCCDAVKLTAQHTQEAARLAEKTADYALLTASYVRECIEANNDKT